MCGIFCSLSRSSHVSPDEDVLKLLQRRGPDSTSCAQHTYCPSHEANSLHEESGGEVFLTFTSTVLSLRGSRTVTQPLQDADSSHVLCWNGEAWSIAGRPAKGNDTEAVFEKLTAASSRPHHAGTDEEMRTATIARCMTTVAGPHAFVFYDKPAGKVYLGRDFLGRRALLWRTSDSGDLFISSVTSGSHDNMWTEVEADGIYCIDLNATPRQQEEADPAIGVNSSFTISKVPYEFANVGTNGTLIGNSSAIPSLSLNEELVAGYVQLTQESRSVLMLEQLLRDSLAPRVLSIPNPPLLPGSAGDGDALTPTRLAILFSGGLDCTVLARLSHELLPVSEPIDLLNVAFQNPRIHKAANDDPEAFEAALESCPDRITGRASYAELCKVCSDRQWRFVAINIPYTEFMEHQERVITLMHPHNTEMDLSIASALYFAARGTGKMCSSGRDYSMPYTTRARVLLSGLGADELFAGYTRHATAYNRHGFQGLIDELNLDIGRLGKRNLGRDDRVITNWGKEARFPFLDERLVAWALASPVSEKCDFGAAVVDDSDLSAELESCKKVLRCLAWRLGMCKVASEKKRAIQFGARTAKMTTGKSKGTTLLS